MGRDCSLVTFPPAEATACSSAASPPGRCCGRQHRLSLCAPSGREDGGSCPHHQEASEIGRVIFHAFDQHHTAIDIGRLHAGDGSRVPVAQLDDLLHGAGGVVKRDGLDAEMLLKEAAALRQRHRVGVDALDFLQVAARHADDMMLDPDHGLAFDEHRMLAQQVVVLHNGSGERVLDRNHDRVDFAFAQAIECIRGKYARNNRRIRNGAKRGLMTERAKLALNSYLHEKRNL